MLRGCVAAALVCVASACGAQDEGVVLMDTSPRLHLADLVTSSGRFSSPKSGGFAAVTARRSTLGSSKSGFAATRAIAPRS